jgi:pimeloyl-ACP methyl ester carboxylesterase
MLAYRNPEAVSRLIMASPPTWSDLIHPLPEADLKRNYDSLSLPIVEPFLFKLLETRYAIRLFSNLFLFSNGCDERWLDMIMNSGSISIAAREPIKAFNAGLLNHKSYENELQSLIQPTLILSGSKDKRFSERIQFNKDMVNCTLKMLDGLNVLPWENPTEFKRIVLQFAYHD